MKGLGLLQMRNCFHWSAAALVLAGASCQQPTSNAGTAEPSLINMDAAFTTYSMDSYLTTEGVRSGQVHADTASFYEETAQWRLLGVRMTVFDEVGAAQATVVADSGRLVESTEQMTAWGNVQVELPGSGCRITSAELVYDPPAEQIRTDKPVEFRQGGRVTRGSGFTSDLRFENFSILQPVGPINICARTSGP
jgi:LPS export ABC transporter protein LptC